jgi:hypothetical protein
MSPALRALAASLCQDDPHFAEGLRRGCPVEPKEYRAFRQDRWIIGLAAAQASALCLRIDIAAVALGVMLMLIAGMRRSAGRAYP